MYLNTQPQRMLFHKKKVLVPRLTSNTKKRYKTIRLKPPALMKNQWFFQQDMCKTPLLVLTTSACSFEQPYYPENQISNNITLYTLNTDFFHNPDFESCPVQTHGYVAKVDGPRQFRLFGVTNQGQDPPDKWSHVVPLTRTNQYTEGRTPTNISNFNNPSYWGNPFSEPWSHIDQKIYYQTDWPTESTWGKPVTFTELEYLYQECRYNPDKDTGLGNIVYLKQNNHTTEGTIDTLPSKQELIIKGYPLWIVFHAWSDWLDAAKQIQDHFDGYMFIVVTKFIKPYRKTYLFLDKYFRDGHNRVLTETDRLKWHPKYGQQTEVEYYFDSTGPFSPKINRSESIQANLLYSFYFKWGGCPAPMEHIISPCDQEKFPIPNPEPQGLKIQDPNTDKKTYLYYFDERRQQITKKCAKRIRKDSDSDISVTGISALHVPVQTPQEESDETEAEEEDQTPIQQQLLQLREQQHLLRQHLKRLTKRQKLE